MAAENYTTVRELIYNSYANLAMAHTAVDKGLMKYGTLNYMVRARLFKGLKDGTMNIRTLFHDEKIKLQTGQICNYCGSTNELAIDHIFPKKYGGEDTGDNLVYACRACNSSKGSKDLMEWMLYRDQFLPIMIIRRYLKLVYGYCSDKELLDRKVEDLMAMALPFRIDLLPTKFPRPSELVLLPASVGRPRQPPTDDLKSADNFAVT